MPSFRIRVAVLTAATALAVPAVVALAAAPASAHNELLSSNPSDGARLTAMPQEVLLRFAEQTDPRFVRITALDPYGESVATGNPVISGNVVRQSLTPVTSSGRYAVAYRVVSLDGHPVTGTVTFAVTLPSPSPTPSSTTVAAPPVGAPPADNAPQTRTVAARGSNSPDWLPYALAGAGALGVLGVALLLFRSTRRRVR